MKCIHIGLSVLVVFSGVLAACDTTSTPARRTGSATDTDADAGAPLGKILQGTPRVNIYMPPDQHPWNKIGFLTEPGTWDSSCTCVKAINDYTCLSAAHCFVDCRPAKPTWYEPKTDLHFNLPAHLTSTIRGGAYGVTVPMAYVRNCKWPPDQTTFNNDVAIIRLSGRAPNAPDKSAFSRDPTEAVASFEQYNVGFLPVASPRAGYTNVEVHVAGYPGQEGLDRLYWKGYGVGFPLLTYPTLIYGYNGATAVVGPEGKQIHFRIDVEPGMSGGPLFTIDPDYAVVGITAAAHGPSTDYNYGVALTPARIMWLHKYSGHR